MTEADTKCRPILVVDDDPYMRTSLTDCLVSCGWPVETAADGADALAKFRKGAYEMVITDVRMPKMGGLELLKNVKGLSPDTPVIVITAYGTVNTAVEAMKQGAADFVMKPFSLDDLEVVVRNVLERGLQPDVARADVQETGGAARPAQRPIVTEDARMAELLEFLKNIAKSRSSVLIQGESGTGKELLARFIHYHSPRRHQPFVAVNCAAIPHTLLESEMFGYEKGAFTGAAQRRIGKFELADRGTLLLDEVSEMDMPLQAKLLRVIQECEIDRLGGKDPIPVDARIIATTNADLKACIREKKFREDLYYRLNVIPVRVPPLRERKGDIAALAGHFLAKYAAENGRKKPVLTPETLAALAAYPWPGNVRELENVIERAVLVCPGDALEPHHLDLDGGGIESGAAGPEPPSPAGGATTLRDMEKHLIFSTLKRVRGNKTKASEILGISVRTMRNKLNEYKLEQGSPDAGADA
ncbi:MAG: sigma-54-dependent Fis family transcriptional regulator [Syntrophaceae bacterium]|nr:sigma-54-dependent Fis family transcriptional regulator [Syntrophaceae bacterium]